jgi:hypothetical protein
MWCNIAVHCKLKLSADLLEFLLVNIFTFVAAYVPMCCEQLIYLVVLCIAVISLYWDIKTLVSTRKNTSFEVKVINQDQ